MYLDDYKRWMEADLEDAALKTELESIEGNDEEIKEILQFYGSDLIIQQLKIEKKSPFYSTIKKQLKKHLNYEI